MFSCYAMLFPTLTCGVFVFSSVSAPPPSRPSRPHSLTHSHSLTLTHSHSLTHSGSASFAWQAWDNVHCQGVGCTPRRPSGFASFAWQAWDNVHVTICVHMAYHHHRHHHHHQQHHQYHNNDVGFRI